MTFFDLIARQSTTSTTLSSPSSPIDSMSILISFLIGLLVTGIPYAIHWLREWNSLKKPFKKFWTSMFIGGMTIITASEEREKIVRSQVLDFVALSDATREFNVYFKGKFDVETCDNMSQSSVRKNLLLVGGPIPNSMTKHLHEEMGDVVTYAFRIDKQPNTKGTRKGNQIINVHSSRVVRAPKFKGDLVVEDYGIITKYINPFNSERHIIIVEGCYGWGTWASLNVILNPRFLKLLLKENVFQVIVSVRMFNRTPGEPQLVPRTLIKLT